MKSIKYLAVVLLDRTDHLLDQIPRYSEGRWYRDGDWGCSLGLSDKSFELDERWQTGYWSIDDSEEVQIQGPPSADGPDDGGTPSGMGCGSAPHYH